MLNAEMYTHHNNCNIEHARGLTKRKRKNKKEEKRVSNFTYLVKQKEVVSFNSFLVFAVRYGVNVLFQ